MKQHISRQEISRKRRREIPRESHQYHLYGLSKVAPIVPGIFQKLSADSNFHTIRNSHPSVTCQNHKDIISEQHGDFTDICIDQERNVQQQKLKEEQKYQPLLIQHRRMLTFRIHRAIIQ